ncbi:hypothetical protein GCM10022409_11300 [Hymenobacter glaciei]|uniref:DUF4168 domain-containing protein n=1 Tax=Hymenobacter glaciei TaxID=877209 RepID=A0ABP7TNK4_9BACT
MNKTFLLSLALLGNTLAASAQTTQPVPATMGVQRVRVSAAEMNPELEAARTADQLTGQLTLSPAQTTRVRAAARSWSQARRDLLVKHNGLRDHSTLQAEGAAIETQYETQLKSILTPAQEERRQMIRARFRKIREEADAREKAGK